MVLAIDPRAGEFVRLALEAGGIAYRDCARREGGEEALVADMMARAPHGPFAPPYLVAGDLVIAQTAHILAWLAIVTVLRRRTRNRRCG